MRISNSIPDEDVMSNERLETCRQGRERQIKLLIDDFQKVHAALNKLSLEYSNVKSQCFCCRYFSLKRIIENAIEETDAATHYQQ
ncbi:hypothetical protein ElyMa_001688900 [Elysia marginata]|uniref:Syntaxin N-terminal domain-containing protein n=1 Tax=Elysia marginata TaxID=1093978 RepID=A0AAV4JRZ9_9GAST|nr:hypothetical protein ElyMa_001688900 [Elysia marginata]